MATPVPPNLGGKLRSVESDLSRTNRATILKNVGDRIVGEVDTAVRSTPAIRGSLSDASMSGWRRGKPMLVEGMVSATPSSVSIRPKPRSRGPMRVLESGREPAEIGISRPLGGRGGRTRKVTRRIGATQGKGTWTAATVRLRARFGPEVLKEVHAVLERHF